MPELTTEIDKPMTEREVLLLAYGYLLAQDAADEWIISMMKKILYGDEDKKYVDIK